MTAGGQSKARPVLALTLTFPGLLACSAAVVFLPHDGLSDPFLLALCACAIAAGFVLIDLEGTLFWGGSLVPYVCAFAALGPVPAVVVGIVGEIAVWLVDRYSIRVFPLNVLSVLGPNLLGGTAVMEFAPGPDGILFYVAVLGIALGAVALNLAMITTLAGVFYGQHIAAHLRNHLRLAPAVAINVLVALATIAVYFHVGAAAAVFALGGVLGFSYLAGQIAAERTNLDRISRLAAEREALLARVLEAEDYQRRASADLLHDDILQAVLAARQDLEEVEEGSIERARGALDEAISAARRVIAGQHSSALERVGLVAAIQMTVADLARRANFETHVDISPQAVGTCDRLVYSTTRELLANAAKHSSATRVAVRLERTEDGVTLSVEDDGVGIDLDRLPRALTNGHIGLASIEERVRAEGGRLTIGVGRGSRGTQVRASIPARA